MEAGPRCMPCSAHGFQFTPPDLSLVARESEPHRDADRGTP